ncbi:hypothetical protein E2C01_068946 [Portunus trituberculatus]|uniref:Uncharacterized protein n=1 Tax=Portunus trituberculatus TaxID=210409 RepID=A0A5B7HTC8_PORTR|nr:hypothetical protein [Portunus trituberculatus]
MEIQELVEGSSLLEKGPSTLRLFHQGNNGSASPELPYMIKVGRATEHGGTLDPRHFGALWKQMPQWSIKEPLELY